MAQKLIAGVFYIGPLLFALGFLWPLFAQVFEYWDFAPFGLSALWAGGALALALGLAAQLRGTWIWAR